MGQACTASQEKQLHHVWFMLCSLPTSWGKRKLFQALWYNSSCSVPAYFWPWDNAESETELLPFFTFMCKSQICGLSEVLSPAWTMTEELQGSGWGALQWLGAVLSCVASPGPWIPWVPTVLEGKKLQTTAASTESSWPPAPGVLSVWAEAAKEGLLTPHWRVNSTLPAFSSAKIMNGYLCERRKACVGSWTEAVAKDSDNSVTKVQFDSAINQHCILAACAIAREADAFESLALLYVQRPFSFSSVASLPFMLHSNFQGWTPLPFLR